jgi:cell wall-associated NlpC family hydrolase
MNQAAPAAPAAPRCDPEALARAAEAWAGTPFAPNSCRRGAGVCCHQLLGAIYREAGWLPDLPPLPPGSPAHARAGQSCPMLDWLLGPGLRWFLPLARPDDLRAGDLLLVRHGHVPHHLALVLPEGRVVHVSPHHGVVLLPVLPRRWRAAISHAFRPRAAVPEGVHLAAALA